MASKKRANRELKMPVLTGADRPFMMQLVARVLGMVMRLLFNVKLLKGKENVPVAIARRRIKAGGDVKSALALIPITKPVYALYRSMLEADYPQLVVK